MFVIDELIKQNKALHFVNGIAAFGAGCHLGFTQDCLRHAENQMQSATTTYILPKATILKAPLQ